ncbi:MAG: FkbM family methyltransferase [Solirubrobacteraceae bacterium]
MIPRLLPPLQRLLSERDVEIVLVDVGARNGVGELPHLASRTRAVGFEPNPAEFDKLVRGETDVILTLGIDPIPYRDLVYLPYALGKVSGRAPFHVTPGAGAAGMLEPDLARLDEIVWKGRRRGGTLGDEVYRGYETIEVDVRRLDELAVELDLEYVDCLKIDVEGFEHDVLEGAGTMLSRVGVVRVETFFVPVLKGQRLFADTDTLLRANGFELLRIEIDPAQVVYKERTAPVEELHDPRLADPHAQLLAADAVYVNRHLVDPARVLAQAAVLLEREYVDEALHRLRLAEEFRDDPFLDLLEHVRIDSPSMRLRGAGYRAIDAGVTLAQRLSGALHAVGCGRRA